MSRAATSGELAILRSDGLAAKIFAIVDQPVVVYQAQVNQVFTTHDQVAEAAYNNATGTLANVLPGMTVLVGSTPGARDKGLARVRKAWTGSAAYLGEGSEIDWVDDLYLTVIDEFSIWPRHLRVSATNAWMDYDIAYSDQHTNYTPVPALGPDRVLKLVGDDVSVQLSASASWVPGSTITGYAWAVVRGTGASLTGGTTATPTLTATAAGRILIACTVTAANGKTATGYRTVHVYDADNTPVEITLGEWGGSHERGGFDVSFQLPVSPGFSPRDYTKVILFSESQPEAIGPVTGAENLLFIGWMDEADCAVDDKGGTASISARGANYWLSRINGYPSGIENVNGTPAKWTQIQGLTVDKMLHHFITWRTTLANCVDWFATGDTRSAPSFQAPNSNLWQQIATIAEKSILAAPVCDPLSRLRAQVDANYLPVADRAGIPVVMTLTGDDIEYINVTARTAQDVSQVDLSGVSASGSAFFSLAPGRVFGRYGQPMVLDRLLLSSQAQANALAGLVLGREQRAYDFEIGLVSANRLLTLSPRQYLEIDISAGDTPAGIAYSGRVLPREVVIEHNPETGIETMRLVCEPETFPTPAVTSYPPGSDTPFPPFPPIAPPPPLPPPDLPLPVIVPALRVVYALVQHLWGTTIYASTNALDPAAEWIDIGVDLAGDTLSIYGFEVDWLTGAVYVRGMTDVNYESDVIYRSVPYQNLDGSLTPTPLVPWRRPSDFGRRTINGFGINPLTGEAVVVASDEQYFNSGARAVFVGNVRSGDFSLGGSFTDDLWWHAVASIGNGRIVVGFGGISTATTLWTSDNGGSSWTNRTSTTAANRINHIRPNPTGSLLYHWHNSTLAISSDLGSSSNKVSSSVLWGSSMDAIAADPTGTVILAAKAGAPQELFRSVDGGLNFTDLAIGVPTYGVAWAGQIDTGHVFIRRRIGGGGTQLPSYTLDSGATWTDIPTPWNTGVAETSGSCIGIKVIL